jgi:hypothetical protein
MAIADTSCVRHLDDPRPAIIPTFARSHYSYRHLEAVAAAEQIRAWLSTCAGHERCREAGIFLPKRLLEVRHDKVRLVDTEQLLELVPSSSRAMRYVAVSHCWGTQAGIVPPKTTQANIASRKVDIPWSDLPALFRDIIELLRQLEYRYVWIDSLCIIQGDKEDWIEQSLQMGKVYSHADITFSAASSRHCNDRLLGRTVLTYGDNDQLERVATTAYPCIDLKGLDDAGRYADIHVRDGSDLYGYKLHGYFFQSG